MRLLIDVKSILSSPLTYLRAAVSAGSSVSADVQNTSGLAGSDFVVVGRLGEERSEIKSLSSITDIDTLVFSSLSFSHPNNSIIQKVLYDQIKVERSADGSSYSVITTLTISGDQSTVEYNDTSGTSSSYYRIRFYNSTTTTYSDYTQVSQRTNPSFTDTLIADIKTLVNEDDDDISTDRIFRALATVDMRIARVIVKLNPDYFKTSTTINLVSGTQEYALPTDFVRATQIKLKLNSTDTLSESTAMPQNWGDGTESLTGLKFHYIIQNASDGLLYLGLKDTISENVTSGIKVWYVKRPVRITAVTDTLNTPHPTLFYDIIRAGVLWELFMYDKDRQDLAKESRDEFAAGIPDIINLVNANDDSEQVQEYSTELMSIFSAME